jgi:hypothetical protein
MMIPDTLVFKRQAFSVVGFREHTNRHGYPVPLTVLQAPCKECGKPFETTVLGKNPRLDKCRRRCRECSPPRQTKARPAQDLRRPAQMAAQVSK